MGASFVQTVTSQTMKLDVSKTLGGSRDLTGLCTDIFLIVIRMREAEDLGEPAALRKLINFYLDLFTKNCRALGVENETIGEAKYALVALLDETVLSIPGACRDYWFSRPLQLDLFGDNLAGEEFYKKLNRMLERPEKKKDVLEVYYICLSLGFEGKYKITNADQRVGLIDELGRKLRRTRMRVSSGLSPHGKRGEVTVGQRKFGRMPFPLWVPAAVSVAGTVAAWVIMETMASSNLDSILRTLKMIP